VASASEDRLEKLIQERLRPGSDKEAVDRRIWDLFGEQWCVMFTDLSGFSRNVAEFGIIHFLQTIYEAERILVPIIEGHDGILLKVEGDSFLVIFRNVHKGLQAAVAMQRALARYNADRSDAEKVLLCVGLGYGSLLRIGDLDVFGEEVNSASKLGEDVAKAWDILVTEAVQQQAGSMAGVSFELLDERIAGQKRAYRMVYSR
jgi:class 3 adenylate cyclase